MSWSAERERLLRTLSFVFYYDKNSERNENYDNDGGDNVEPTSVSTLDIPGEAT